jgi:hypothetical protein
VHKLLKFIWLGALLTIPLAASDAIFFSRTFPGSGPPYFEVRVDTEGHGSYKESHDEEPLEFTLSNETREWLFSKAAALDHFKGKLASKRKVAFTGDKVLRFESNGATQGEAKFSYTEDETASELVTWFVRVSETERYYIDLERALQFDRLGVNDALLNLHTAYDNGRIVAPEQFLPILRKVVDQQKIMHVARSRASALIERITAPPKE